MITVCVSELTGAALDWAVAKCEDEEVYLVKGQLETRWTDNGWKPSTDWAQGGPIIEREELSRLRCYGTNQWECLNGEIVCEGATPLIAAMRCYVASKLGENIDIPDELYND